MPQDRAKEVHTQDSSIERVRSDYREALEKPRYGRREFLRKTRDVLAATALGIPFPSSTAEAGGGDKEALKRRDMLWSIPGNENAVLGRNSVERDLYVNRQVFKSVVSSFYNGRYEFPEHSESTWGFGRASVYRDRSENSAFLDDFGSFFAEEDVDKIFQSLPDFKPFIYHSPDSKKSPFANHALVIPKDVVPAGGYIMVFSRPDRPESEKALFDRWQYDGSLYSETVKVKGGHNAQIPVMDAYTIMVDTQDRVDRYTPFYNKDNPAKVEKIVVVFDPTGQAVSKFDLTKTEFYPRPDWLDKQKTIEALGKVNINFTEWYALKDYEQRIRASYLLGVGGDLKVDTPDLRLHTTLFAPDHVQIDLNMDLTKHPRPAGDGHPVQIRIPIKQYEKLKEKFKVVTEGSAESKKHGIFPGDLIIPEGTSLPYRFDFLPRGQQPTEWWPVFVLLKSTSLSRAR